MSWNLQQTINWAQTFIQYSPLTAGLGGEPAVSIASMIRTSLLNPPMTWAWNRGTTTFNTVVGQQDYTVSTATDLAFVEKVMLADDQGNIFEIKDVYNSAALAKSSALATNALSRPNAMSVESSSGFGASLSFVFRFIGVPDQIYAVTVIYQKIANQFGPFFISSVGSAAGGNTTYTGTFDPLSFPTGATAIISGFSAAANNGSFVVVSCTNTSLVVANASGVAATAQGYVSNYNWDPIPDYYQDVFNNLFLSEAMVAVDDARATLYRQRGVAALLSKASGLTETQKNAFAQQWLHRDVERQALMGAAQLGYNGRGV